jgi:adenosylhomocysteinase
MAAHAQIETFCIDQVIRKVLPKGHVDEKDPVPDQPHRQVSSLAARRATPDSPVARSSSIPTAAGAGTAAAPSRARTRPRSIARPPTWPLGGQEHPLPTSGRKEIEFAEHEMPGLIAVRENTARQSPPSVRVTGSLHMTIQTAVLIETLVELGADVRWASATSSPPRTTPPRPSPPPACPSSPGRARPSRNTGTAPGLPRQPRGRLGPQLVVDDGGDVTLLIHKGVKSRRRIEGSTARPPQRREQVIKDLLKTSPSSPQHLPPMAKDQGRLRRDHHRRAPPLRNGQGGKLLFPAINVNDSVTKSKFDNLYGCRESLVDGIKRATDVMIAGKVAWWRATATWARARPVAARPRRPRARHRDRPHLRPAGRHGRLPGHVTMEDTLGKGDIYVTTTGNKDVITLST